MLLNKYWVDEFYWAVVVWPLYFFSVFLWKVVDVIFIDGFLNGTAHLYSVVSQGRRHVQSGRRRSYAAVFVAGAIVLLGYFILE